MIINEDEDILFSTGKKRYASFGIIGLGIPDDESKFWVTTGYDDDMYYETSLTTQEKIELADYMIDLWQKFKSDVNFKPKT